MTKKLWETDHPYYMTCGNYYSNDCHSNWGTWAGFISEFGDADLDYNWFVRWDWLEGEDSEAGEYTGDDYYRHAIFRIQMIGQRKAYLGTHDIAVCRADEPAIRQWLRQYWDYMKIMWDPISGDEA